MPIQDTGYYNCSLNVRSRVETRCGYITEDNGLVYAPFINLLRSIREAENVENSVANIY